MANDKHEQHPPAPTPTPTPQPAAAAKADDKAAAELQRARAAASIGAQVILDFNEAASIGARGGAGGSIEENTAARDKCLVDMGLDPVAPSGPPPSQEQLAAMRKMVEEPPKMFLPPATGKASRTSSLAAGISDPSQIPAGH